jgi:hypothetical protein
MLNVIFPFSNNDKLKITNFADAGVLEGKIKGQNSWFSMRSTLG